MVVFLVVGRWGQNKGGIIKIHKNRLFFFFFYQPQLLNLRRPPQNSTRQKK